MFIFKWRFRCRHCRLSSLKKSFILYFDWQRSFQSSYRITCSSSLLVRRTTRQLNRIIAKYLDCTNYKLRKRLKCPLFLVREGPKHSMGVWGACSPGKFVKFAGSEPSSPPRASMLFWSAWTNISAYNTWRNKKNWSHTKRLNIGRSSVPVKERIRNSRALLKA